MNYVIANHAILRTHFSPHICAADQNIEIHAQPVDTGIRIKDVLTEAAMLARDRFPAFSATVHCPIAGGTARATRKKREMGLDEYAVAAESMHFSSLIGAGKGLVMYRQNSRTRTTSASVTRPQASHAH